jgi:hypothetical protein
MSPWSPTLSLPLALFLFLAAGSLALNGAGNQLGRSIKKIKNGPVSNVVDGCLEHLPWTEVQPSLQRFTNSIQTTETMFIWLIIRLIQLVFSAGTIFSLIKNHPTVFFSRLIIPAERARI